MRPILEEMTPTEVRRLRYRADPNLRARRLNSARAAQDLPLTTVPRKLAWTFNEVCDLLGVHADTFRQYEKLGVIPPPSYPSFYKVYYGYQVLLLMKLFRAMRAEGWPRMMPKMVGSAYWTEKLSRLEQEWIRKGFVHVERKARCGHNDQGKEAER